MKHNNKRIALYRKIWGSIRRWQNITSTPDALLADMLILKNVRTLRDYDTSAANIRLEQLDNFLYENDLTLTSLMTYESDL